MPRVELPHQPELTPALVADILRRRMPELEVRDTKLLGADLLAFQSQALGATLKVKQQPDKQRTLIVVGGLVPNLGLRILLVLIVIIPLLILTWSPTRAWLSGSRRCSSRSPSSAAAGLLYRRVLQDALSGAAARRHRRGDRGPFRTGAWQRTAS